MMVLASRLFLSRPTLHGDAVRVWKYECIPKKIDSQTRERHGQLMRVRPQGLPPLAVATRQAGVLSEVDATSRRLLAGPRPRCGLDLGHAPESE